MPPLTCGRELAHYHKPLGMKVIRHSTVYSIASPNGAGKTTFANNFLQDSVDCRQFLNADLISINGVS